MQMNPTDIGEDVLDVALTGRLDTAGVDQIESQLTDLVDQRTGHTLIGLADVEFVGSMAIRMFMVVGRATVKRGRRLVLYAPQPLVSRMFETVSLKDIVPIALDREDALRIARS
jgi:anti-sigma B factor antagonist